MESVKKKAGTQARNPTASGREGKIVAPKSMQQRGKESLMNKLLFVLLGLIVFRLGICIGIPGINPGILPENNDTQSQLFGFINLWSGGTTETTSIFRLGLGPYIACSMLFNALCSTIPYFKELRSDGPLGRQKIKQYTRGAAFVWAFLQAPVMLINIPSVARIIHSDILFYGLGWISLLAGFCFLMWLSELMTSKGIGHGSSIIIFAGIVQRLPVAITKYLKQYQAGDISNLWLFSACLILILFTFFVACVESAQRRIAVHYAQKDEWHHGASVPSTVLPLKVNLAGFLPIPAADTVFTVLNAGLICLGRWFANAQWITMLPHELSKNQWIGLAIYAFLIIAFGSAMSELQMDTEETANRLKKSSAFITGVRPGFHTAKFLEGIRGRLWVLGSCYLVLLACAPQILAMCFKIPIFFDGTSLLIVVNVIMEFVEQIQTHLVSRQYESLLKKSHFRTLKV